jgi:cytidine deaminase
MPRTTRSGAFAIVEAGLGHRPGGHREHVAPTPTDTELIALARSRTERAYAPYSKFETAAAVTTDDGEVVVGVLVENVSLGLAMCAERAAMFSVVARGARPTRLALAAPSTAGSLTWPCGACLQVALELGGRDLVVVVGDDDAGPIETSTVGALLPNGPKVDLD